MSNSWFRFKRFSVEQGGAAMKVGTDGVLLGAWSDIHDAHRRYLDVGAGTGVIALMTAQKISDKVYYPETAVDAIEIDEAAAGQADENFKMSPWTECLCVHNISVQKYFPKTKYDHIISNPPWFINALKPDSEPRILARHTEALSYEDLLFNASRLLAEHGVISVIIPAENEKVFLGIAHEHGFVASRYCAVRSLPDRPPIRTLLELRRKTDGITVKSDEIIIEDGRSPNSFTEEYRRLTGDFYLKF